MSDTPNPSGLPDAVRRMMEIAAQQRAAAGGGSAVPLSPAEEAKPEGDTDPESPTLSDDEKLEECRLEPETDIGNSRRFLIRYGDRILNVARVAWHGFDGKRWKEDEDGSLVRPLAQKTAEWIMDEAFGLDAKPEEQAAILKGDEARKDMRALEAERRAREVAWTPEESEAKAAIGERILKGSYARADAKSLADERKAREDKAPLDGETERAAELAAIIKDADLAKADLRALEAARQARAAEGWSAAELAAYERLKLYVDEGAQAKEAVASRESSRFRHAKSSAGTSKINNMLIEAAPHVSKVVGDLNRDRYALNCASGTIRFVLVPDPRSETGSTWRARLDPHRQGDLITKLAPQRYRPSGSWDTMAPTFAKFLATVQPDPELRAFLQRFVGYCLTGLTDEQCLLFLYGIGRNGKSTFIDIIVEMIGDYAVTLSIDSFSGDTKRGGAEATPDLARLPGARVVMASEPEMGVKLKDALIKTLTGGDKIPVRRLHQDFIEVDPQFKIILSGNHKPRIDDTSDGIWRRVHLVPFDIQIPREQIDRMLPRKLRAEAEGVFAWAIQGALDYLNRGLQPPEKVLAATQEYREESDPIGTFIRIGCIVTGKEEDAAAPSDLFVAYSNWAGLEGAAEFKKNTFFKRFPDYALKTWEGPDGRMHAFWKGKSGSTVYRGIRIRDEHAGSRAGGGASGEAPYPDDYVR